MVRKLGEELRRTLVENDELKNRVLLALDHLDG